MGCLGWPEALPRERQASKIGDPVERLRLLREVTRDRQESSSPHRAVPPRPARPVLAALLLAAFAGTTSDALRPAFSTGFASMKAPAEAPEVWLAEKTTDWELYSNGLRIEYRLAVSTRPRLYRLLPPPGSQDRSRRFETRPAGIVFHAFESELAFFAPEYIGWMKRQSLDLIAYARRRRLYHYVVDRFGRVHRIVEEADVADHAGHSVWAGAEGVYLDLNASFLAVAFEVRTRGEAEAAPLSPAQLQAGRALTELLRGKHRIRPENCLTHAQVSVNPFNSVIGFHADWARQFPFASLGLPDNYLQPPPSVSLFGFAYEPAFFEAAAPSLRAGLLRAEEELRRQAAARNLTPARWRAGLLRRYREAAAEAATERVALEALARLEVYQP